MSQEESDGFALSHLRRLHDVIGRVNGSETLKQTLERVATGVVEVVGFRVAAINLMQPDGRFEVVVVAGDPDAESALLGGRLPADAFEEDIAVAERWGDLYFVPHQRGHHDGPVSWFADVVPVDEPDAWHPLDALYVPLRSVDGRLVGMLSVDLPTDMRRPGVYQRELLELFAVQAGIAIENARLTERLAASEKVFRLAFAAAGTGMALIDMSAIDTGRYLQVNQALCDVLGYTAEELLALRLDDITYPADRLVFTDLPQVHVSSSGQTVHREEKRYVGAGGREVWVAETLSVVGRDDGAPLYGITQVEDIRARKAATDALTHEVDHDALTGLLNRRNLEPSLLAAADSAVDLGHDGAVLFCDIDSFKAVNDQHGHAVGDRVLVVVAQRMAAAVRAGDTVLRVYGDEFVVVAEDIDLLEADALAERLRAAVAEPISVGPYEIRTTMSIGVSPITAHRGDPGTVLALADGAMYRAKLVGRGVPAVR